MTLFCAAIRMVTKESQKSSPHGVRKSSCGNFTRVVMASMLVLMGGFVASRLYALDISDVLLGTEPTPHGMEMCSHVSGPKGMEDVQIVGGRFAYFSADSREWVHRQHVWILSPSLFSVLVCVQLRTRHSYP